MLSESESKVSTRSRGAYRKEADRRTDQKSFKAEMPGELEPVEELDLSAAARARSSRQNTRTTSVSNPDHIPVPPLTRTAVSLEYASLRHTGHCPLGMYVTPSPDNLMVWDAVFFVHQGPSLLAVRVARVY